VIPHPVPQVRVAVVLDAVVRELNGTLPTEVPQEGRWVEVE
jgi:hypothetical protein